MCNNGVWNKLLKSLYIKNFALIDELTVEFSKGLNIITGETGAGKSIMVDAFMVALGDRASATMVRSNERKAIIEAVFDIETNDSALEYLRESEIEYGDNELILRRELNTNGSSRSFICDSPVSLSVMKGIGDLLVDFHGQHEHQLLLDTKYHIKVLDSVCEFGELKNNYRIELSKLKSLINTQKELIIASKESAIRLDHYTYELDEITKLNPKENELDEVENQLNLIENSERIFSLCSAVNDALDDSNSSARNILLDCRKNLEQLNSIDSQFMEYLTECNSALISVQEIAKFAQNYRDKFSFDPIEIEAIRVRSLELNGLRKKYGSYVEVFQRCDFLKTEINKILNFDDEIKELSDKINNARIMLGKIALQISAIRREQTPVFCEKIIKKLQYLGMENAMFDIKFRTEVSDKNSASIITHSEQTINYLAAFSDGIDKIEFLISTNKGESLKQLKDTASGGEISRIMLSLKSIIAEYQSMPMLVFDEIDTGISGKIGQKTGLVMKELSQHHQILAITHLPQIAALGDNNLFVRKYETAERTSTEIKVLTQNEKIQAIAQMISGEIITESALESARELVETK